MKKSVSTKIIIKIIVFVIFVGCSGETKFKKETTLWPEIEPFQTGYLKGFIRLMRIFSHVNYKFSV